MTRAPPLNGKPTLAVAVFAIVLFVVALLIFQPYSADWPGTAYAKPAQRFIRTAMRQDSAGLVRLSASSSAVAWALDVGREHPDLLRHWGPRVATWIGERVGDTTEVFVYPTTDVCGDAPIVLGFVGSGTKARVVRASSTCRAY
jgi:hypothetical protein